MADTVVDLAERAQRRLHEKRGMLSLPENGRPAAPSSCGDVVTAAVASIPVQAERERPRCAECRGPMDPAGSASGLCCSDCQRRAEVEREERASRAHELVLEAGWGKKHCRATPDQFAPAVREAVRGFFVLMHQGEAQGALITGVPGTGKTHLTAAIARALLVSGRRVRFVKARALLREIRESYGDDARSRESQVLEAFARLDLLVVDDLAREGRVNDHVTGVWQELLDVRLDNFRPVVVTTNLTEAELGEVYGAAIASRLFGLEVQIDLGGADRRQERRG